MAGAACAARRVVIRTSAARRVIFRTGAGRRMVFRTGAGRMLLLSVVVIGSRLRVCLLRGGFVYIVPTAVVVFLPARAGVLIDIAVVVGVHVAACTLAGSRIAVGRAGRTGFGAGRALRSGFRTVRVALMLRVCGLAVLVVDRLSPGSIGV